LIVFDVSRYVNGNSHFAPPALPPDVMHGVDSAGLCVGGRVGLCVSQCFFFQVYPLKHSLHCPGLVHGLQPR
jgi:hypothetical protein